MNKVIKTTSLILTAAALLVFPGCSGSGNEDESDSAPVAYIENPPEGANDYFTIKYSDWHNEYAYRMARYGYTEENDAVLASDYRLDVIKTQVQDKILLYLAKDIGITEDTLTEEEKKELDESTQQNVDQWCELYKNDAISELGGTYTDEELYDKEYELFTNFLSQYGLTPHDLYTWSLNAVIQQKFIAASGVTDQEVEDFVQETVNTAKDKYENDLAAFEQSYTPFYMPAGSRKIQQILVMIDKNTRSEITAYRNDGDDEKADEILNAALEKLRFRIDEAYEKLENGESWESVQKEYNDESDANGVDYIVYPKSSTIDERIIGTAMAIPNKGEYSPIRSNDAGYFILYYSDDAVFSDEQLQSLNDQAREFLEDQASYQKILDFMNQYPYIFDYGLLNIEEGSLESATTAEEQ